MMLKKIKLNKSEILFISFMFLSFFAVSIILPFNNAPDESARYLVPQYIYNHLSLPAGNDLEVMIPNWGFSYAFQPIFSYIVSGIFMKTTSLFTTAEFPLLVAARFASVLFSTLTVYFTVKIGNLLFDRHEKWIFISLVSTLPMFAFVSSYVNTDALAITSTAVLIYAWILGLKNDWNKQSLIYLTIGLCLCALSYQNAYGYILTTVLLFFAEIIKKFRRKDDLISFLKKGLIVGIITFFIGGSTYIRNYYLYDGDFLGTTAQNNMAEQYAIEELKPSNKYILAEDDVSFTTMFYNLNWLETSYRSFVGVFGYMSVNLPNGFYSLYNAIFISGLLGVAMQIKKIFKKHSYYVIILNGALFLNVIFGLLLNVMQSYIRDFQPQGRYSLPLLIPLMYFMTKGIIHFFKYVKDDYVKLLQNSLACGLLISNISILIFVFVKHYM